MIPLHFAGLFIVDGYYDVYVWEGWMPEDDDDVRTGSGRQRWDRDRRLAMETALSYAKGLLLRSVIVNNNSRTPLATNGTCRSFIGRKFDQATCLVNLNVNVW